jgi:hypothetical protein
MNSSDAMSNTTARRALTELDAELARLDERVDERRRQRMALAKLRAVCEPYMRENPNLTVAEALAMDRQTHPAAYRKPD